MESAKLTHPGRAVSGKGGFLEKICKPLEGLLEEKRIFFKIRE